MATDRRRMRRSGGVLVAAGATLLAGCASMPGSGDVQRVDSSQRSESDSQVRVSGVSPQEDALPKEIVRGFLEAVTSDEADFDKAREYLTPERRAQWEPFASTTVLATGPDFGPQSSGSDPGGVGETFSIEISGERLAQVDESHVYRPEDGTYRETLKLRQVEGEWRIDALPDGLVLGEADFRRIYRSVNTFYYADLGPDTAQVENGRNVLVADPVYLRRRIDPVGEAVAALLSGPSEWLAPVSRSAFPEGVRTAGGHPPVINDSGVLTVRLSGASREVSGSRCERMAAQLLHTVRDLAASEVGEIRLTGSGGSQLCAQSWTQAQTRAPGLLDGELDHQYFLDDSGQLVSAQDEDQVHQAVPGALGDPAVELRGAAVSREQDWAAGVSADGTRLFVAPLSGGDPLPEPVLVSEAPGDEAGLSAPSWDGLGDLWVADRDPAQPRLLRMAQGTGVPQEIPVEGLRSDQWVESLRVASDGVRIAMLVRDESGTSLQLGRVQRTRTSEDVAVTVDELRPLAPALESVTAASWAGGSRLVIVGRPDGGVEQLQYVNTDGSSSSAPTVPGLTNVVTGVAAAEGERQPLLAETEEGIARLEYDANWRLFTKEGSAPFYPG